MNEYARLTPLEDALDELGLRHLYEAEPVPADRPAYMDAADETISGITAPETRPITLVQVVHGRCYTEPATALVVDGQLFIDTALLG